MRHRRALVMLAAALVLVLGVSGCARVATEADESDPAASAQSVPGTDLQRVTLAPGADKQMGLETQSAVAATTAPSAGRVVIPVSAVIYDPKGGSWTYCEEAARTFQRHPITIDRIEGTNAVLSNGPNAGTTVVTVGASELLGVEYGVGEE